MSDVAEHAKVTEDVAASGDEQEAKVQQAEGLSFFRVVGPFIAGADRDAASIIAGVLDQSQEPGRGDGEKVPEALESTDDELAISGDEVGELSS